MSGLISDNLKELNKQLHNENKDFGSRAHGGGCAGHLTEAVLRLHQLGACRSLLDYGTGKGLLVKRLQKELPPEISVSGYDPAVSEWAKRPTESIDLVTCLDVLEHVEMESIDVVLDDIKRLTKRFCYVVVDLQPAVKTMADGRNAHILLAPPEWWIQRFSQLFPCVTAFPIMHKCGKPQKIAIGCTKKPKFTPYLYELINRLQISNLVVSGGPLDLVR